MVIYKMKTAKELTSTGEGGEEASEYELLLEVRTDGAEWRFW